MGQNVKGFFKVMLGTRPALAIRKPYKGKTINLKFSRTGLTASKPVTICLPFAYSPKTSDGTFYTLDDVSKVGGMWQATMTEFTGTTL